MVVRGVMVAVFTPLNKDFKINYGIIPAYYKFLVDNGVKSILVGGTTGEHMSLALADRKKVIDEWMKVNKTTGLHLQVQVGGAPLPDVLDLAAYCQQIGVDSLLTLPELYFRPTTLAELVSYVGLVASAAPKLPVLYYHSPKRTMVTVNMPAFLKEATSCIPNFKGIKLNTSDLNEGAQIFRALKEDQEIFIADETLLASAAILGMKSTMATSFTLFPRIAQEIFDAVDKNDVAGARALQEKLNLAIEAHLAEGAMLPTMKATMEIVTGINVGPPLPPLTPISEEAKKRIVTKLKSLSLA